jgi:hypothetical protein
MIEILYNKLRASDDISITEWKDVDPIIFDKHSQHSQHSQHNLKVDNEPKKEPIITVEKKEYIESIPHEHTKIQQQLDQQLTNKSSSILSKKKTTKDTTIKPLGIIINDTMSFNNSSEYIKEKLITLISKEEFTKIFGLTKCAEIMSGIVNNRWNKSTALFISFLLDKEVYYNDKIVLYNKEKNKGRITVE